MIETLPDFVEALAAAHILDADQLQQVRDELLSRHVDVRALAKDLLRRGWITQLQASYIYHGKGDELVLDPYVLLERLGEGGMGQVFKARHQKLGRTVALKLIRKDELTEAKSIERFKREIAATAQLSHPNVVMAYDADQVGDRYFYVMEYVDGVDLARLVADKGPLSVPRASAYTLQAALALQHAFEQGLVHRDIKPGNLLVTADGATVKLLDLGLARIRGAGPDGRALATVTQIGIFIGTPDFVAPEQAVNSRDVDIRADLYSLGCTYYFLLTGLVPFPGESVMEKLIKHKTEEPIRLETIRPDVPRGVAGIVRKLMAKNPAERYQTPIELVDVLQPFCKESLLSAARLSGSRVRPRPERPRRSSPSPRPAPAPSPPPVPDPVVEPPRPSSSRNSSLKAYSLLNRPRSRREWNRWGLAGAIALVLFGVMLIVLANLVDAQSSAEQPEETPPSSKVSKAAEPKRAPPLMTPLDQLDAYRLPDDTREAWRAAGLELPNELVGTFGQHAWRHWGPVRSVALHPKEQLVASAGDDGVVRLWELESGKAVALLREHAGPIRAVAFSQDGEWLASAGEDGKISLWSVEDWSLKHCFEGHRGEVYALAFPPPHSAMLVSGGADGTVRAWSLKDWKNSAVLDARAGAVWCLAFSPKGDHLAAGTDQGLLKVWEILSRKEVESLESRSKARITGIAFGADDRTVLTADAEGRLLLWVRERRLPRPLPALGGPLHCLTALGGRKLELAFLSGGADGEIHLLRSGRRPEGLLPLGFETKALRGHLGAVTALAAGRLGRTLVSGGVDGTVRVWDLETATEPRTPDGHQGPARSVLLSTDGKTLISAGGKSARVLDLASRRHQDFGEHRDEVVSALPTLDGKQLVTFSHDGTLRLWDAASGREKKVLTGHERPILCAAVSPDGKLVASGDADGRIILWDALTGSLLGKLLNHDDRATALAFSGDGLLLASGCWNGQIIVWDVKSREPRTTFRGGGSEVLGLGFTADSRTLLAAAHRAIHFCDPTDGRVFAKVEQDSRVTAFTILSDNRRLAVAEEIGRLSVWEIGSRQKLWECQMLGPIQALGPAADGRHLAAAQRNGAIGILRLPPSAGLKPY
jgi:WD40 repeat protein/serine/threonine protein kinase